MKQSVLKDIFTYWIKSFREFEECRVWFVISSILLLLTQASGLFETYVLAGITDALYARRQNGFYTYLLIAVGVGTATILISLVNARMDIEIQQRVINKLKRKAMEKICGRGNTVEKFSSGEQFSIVQEDSAAVVGYVYQIISYIFSVGVIIYIGTTLIRISFRWSVLFAIVQVAVAVIQRQGVGRIRERAKASLVCENEFQKYLNEELGDMHAIRFENLGKDVVSFVSHNLDKIKQKKLRQANTSIKLTTLSKSVMYLGKMFLFFGMGREVLVGRVSMKEYIIFYSYMSTFTGNFMSVIQMLTVVQPVLINVRRIIGVISARDQENELIPKFESIEFLNVEKSFGEKILFSGVNLRLNLEEAHAILGINGSGKTTFTKMLLGEEETSKGTVLLDGIPYRDYCKKSMAGICYYAARPCVFSGMTLRDNLLLGRGDKTVSDEYIHGVCRDFLLDEDISQMQNGLNTVLGLDVNLSSGQMKKVELARAAMGDAEVVILDEPMANLDEEFRKQFQSVYKKYFRHRKVLVVEHDQKRVTFAEKVLAIEDGQIEIYV